MTTAAITAGLIFAALVALSIVFDGLARLARVRSDAALHRAPELRYCRADLEIAVYAAVTRAELASFQANPGLRFLVTEHREAVVNGVLDDLDAGNLETAEAIA